MAIYLLACSFLAPVWATEEPFGSTPEGCAEEATNSQRVSNRASLSVRVNEKEDVVMRCG